MVLHLPQLFGSESKVKEANEDSARDAGELNEAKSKTEHYGNTRKEESEEEFVEEEATKEIVCEIEENCTQEEISGAWDASHGIRERNTKREAVNEIEENCTQEETSIECNVSQGIQESNTKSEAVNEIDENSTQEETSVACDVSCGRQEENGVLEDRLRKLDYKDEGLEKSGAQEETLRTCNGAVEGQGPQDKTLGKSDKKGTQVCDTGVLNLIWTAKSGKADSECVSNTLTADTKSVKDSATDFGADSVLVQPSTNLEVSWDHSPNLANCTSGDIPKEDIYFIKTCLSTKVEPDLLTFSPEGSTVGLPPGGARVGLIEYSNTPDLITGTTHLETNRPENEWGNTHSSDQILQTEHTGTLSNYPSALNYPAPVITSDPSTTDVLDPGTIRRNDLPDFDDVMKVEISHEQLGHNSANGKIDYDDEDDDDDDDDNSTKGNKDKVLKPSELVFDIVKSMVLMMKHQLSSPGKPSCQPPISCSTRTHGLTTLFIFWDAIYGLFSCNRTPNNFNSKKKKNSKILIPTFSTPYQHKTCMKHIFLKENILPTCLLYSLQRLQETNYSF